ISPVLGGIAAALLLSLINHTITDRIDKVSAARVWVPIMVAAMTGIFAMYIATKGLSRIWSPSLPAIVALGIGFAALGWIGAMPLVRFQSIGMENRKKHVATLFRLPLVAA